VLPGSAGEPESFEGVGYWDNNVLTSERVGNYQSNSVSGPLPRPGRAGPAKPGRRAGPR
jgi:hypothetical protein